MNTQARLAFLTEQLIDCTRTPRLDVRSWRSGVDYWADLAVVGDDIVGVVRSPRTEILATRYEGVVDFGAVLEKEVAVLGLLADRGVPVPVVRHWRRGLGPEKPSWMLSDYIAHESTSTLDVAQQRQLGAIARAIHGIAPNVPQLRSTQPWPEYFVNRLQERVDAARVHCSLPPQVEIAEAARAVLTPRTGGSLLHMDLRETNLCVEGGSIVGVLDVSNSLAGDPLLELARVRSYGLLTPAFCEGYGIAPEELAAQRSLLDVYQLDTAALLTVVAADEVADAALFAQMKQQAEDLGRQLVDRSGRPQRR